MSKRKTKYDWDFLQKEYDSGFSARELAEKFKIHKSSVFAAMKDGRIKARTISESLHIHNSKNTRKHTQETKDKISLKRIEFIKNNPDKVPYLLNHSSKESYPEKCMREALMQHSILGWQPNYPYHIYRLDFAFPELKIDLEVDGKTHQNENVIEIDNRRNQFLINDGWLVIRIPALEVTRKINQFIPKLQEIILEQSKMTSSGLIKIECSYQTKKKLHQAA